MDNYHKGRLVTSSADDEDIISNLPEDLTDPILKLFPVKDAVITCVLSRKWRYRWTTMKTLAFDKQFSQQFLKIGAFSCNGFIRVLNQIMILHNGPIFKFHLHIPKQIFIDSLKEVDQWMLILSRNNVRELHIVNTNRIYRIPSSVFSCLQLRNLYLSACIFKPPLAFKGFPNLQEIYLLYVNFEGNSGGTVINLPQLKRFKLYSFGDLNQLQGALCMLQNSPNLKRLLVTHMPMGQEADLQLTSNYLESQDCLDQTLLKLQTVEMTSLEGSRPELLFVKLLLNCSPHIENMIIQPKSTIDAEKRHNIAKDVLMFPRASPKAKVVFLDPEP